MKIDVSDDELGLILYALRMAQVVEDQNAGVMNLGAPNLEDYVDSFEDETTRHDDVNLAIDNLCEKLNVDDSAVSVVVDNREIEGADICSVCGKSSPAKTLESRYGDGDQDVPEDGDDFDLICPKCKEHEPPDGDFEFNEQQRPQCRYCGYELSAMLGDNELPRRCPACDREQRRRDEKNGLYPQHEDPAN